MTTTMHTLNETDRKVIMHAIRTISGLRRNEVAEIMQSDPRTARRRLSDAMDEMIDNAITDETLITARRVLIEASMFGTGDLCDAYKRLNVKLAAMLEGVIA